MKQNDEDEEHEDDESSSRGGSPLAMTAPVNNTPHFLFSKGSTGTPLRVNDHRALASARILQ
jgi:hypothetical protein